MPNFIYSQLFVTPTYPTANLDGQTLIVTGSNTGLGLEAARHLVRMGASKVILAVRSLSKGQAAQKSIEETTHRLGVVEVWQLDMEDWNSIKAFAKQAEGLDRLDAILENAGVAFIGGTLQWSEKAKTELTVAVNVIGTFLLALLMLPILRKSGEKYGIVPRLSITSSEVHGWAKFNERNEPIIFDALKKDEPKYIQDRYETSKLLEVLFVRVLSERLDSGPHSSQKVVLNCLNPGLCHSELTRSASSFMHIQILLLKFFLARTTEKGSRTLVASLVAGEESHGQYMGDCVVVDPSSFVLSNEGKKTGERVYKELMEILEDIQPGIEKNI